MASVRPARPEDAVGIHAIYTPIVEQTAISFEEEAPSVEELERRIATSHRWLVADGDGGLAGYAYAGQFHPRAAYRWATEISVYLAEEERGRGIGKQLLAALLDDLREMGFVQAFAGAAVPNPASVGLFRSFGFERIARWERVGFKHDAWHHVDWFQLTLREPSVPPPPLSAPGRPA